METVAFYSYKGGVGRSLLLVNTARFLALTGRRVVALDLDFEAPGLHYKLGVEGKVDTGAVRLIQCSLDGDLPSLDEVRAASIEVPMPATHGGWLHLIPAGPAPKSGYWTDLGRMHERLTASQDAGLLEAVLDLQARIEEAWNPDVLLVDARTGVTGLGGIATMAMCDTVVLMTTRARESLDGICAVADSLRATPTLRGEKRRLEFVVSRVQGTEAVDAQQLRELLGQYFELPHDRYDGGAERLLGDGPPSNANSWWGTNRSVVDSLLARTLTWISKSFPTQADAAARARDRLVAVEDAWRELTNPGGRIGAPADERWHWSPRMLATNVEYGPEGRKRTADIIATLDDGELAIVFEHLDEEPGPDVAQWWSEHISVRVIVLQWQDDQLHRQRKVFFGRGNVAGRDIEASARWSLPCPVEFDLLTNPADRSVDVMLRVAPRTRFYDDLLIVEWVRSMPASLDHGGRPRPEQARKILDGLSTIEEIERAKAFVMSAAESATSRLYRFRSTDSQLDHLVQDGLSAPLCWRAPPLVFIDLARAQHHRTPPVFYALRRLASCMGLDYDPDAIFRREMPELLGNNVDIDSIAEAFLARAQGLLQFEWSTNSLPLSPSLEGSPARNPHSRLAYHGHLGSYTPTTGRIVLAGPTIEAAAKSLGRAPRYVGSVTLLHLSVLGMLHNGIDLDGQRWDGFPNDELPPVTIALAQLFVHRFLVELADDHLLDALEALTDAQPPEYGAWRAMTHVSLEAGRAWMMSIRRGTGGPAPIDVDALLRPR